MLKEYDEIMTKSDRERRDLMEHASKEKGSKEIGDSLSKMMLSQVIRHILKTQINRKTYSKFQYSGRFRAEKERKAGIVS